MRFKVSYLLQVSVIDGKPDPNVTTFAPLSQLVNSNIKYNGNGYMPCNGYVPCQVSPSESIISMNEIVNDVVFSQSIFPWTCWRREWTEPCHVTTTRDKETLLLDAGNHQAQDRVTKARVSILFSTNFLVVKM